MCADGMSFPDMVRKAAILISKRFKHKNMDEEFLYSRREKYRVTGRKKAWYYWRTRDAAMRGRRAG